MWKLSAETDSAAANSIFISSTIASPNASYPLPGLPPTKIKTVSLSVFPFFGRYVFHAVLGREGPVRIALAAGCKGLVDEALRPVSDGQSPSAAVSAATRCKMSS